MSRIVGVDLGGTWLRVATVDTSNRTPGVAIDVHRSVYGAAVVYEKIA